MNQLEDRNSSQFKAQESSFYGEQQAYNTMLDQYEKDMNKDYLSQEERDYAKQKYEETYNDKKESIDNGKEQHGAYDEERTKERISDHYKDSECLQDNDAKYESYLKEEKNCDDKSSLEL